MSEVKNAVIKKTFLGFEDHGIMTCMIDLDYGSCSMQGFGGYAFSGSTAFGMQFIMAVLNVVGVDSWEQLVGKHVRVQAHSAKVEQIGNILDDRWFNPTELAEKYKLK